MSVEADDLRSTLESAFDNAEEGRPTEDATQPVRTAPETTTPDATPAADDSADRGDGRTPRGKFARKDGAAPADGTAGNPPADARPADGQPAQVAKPADHNDKAPQSWKPGAREAWSQLPPDVRAEVHRRERETQRIVQETAQARQVTDFVGQLQQKFAPALQAEGVDALTASANLMNLASRLRFGTPVEKAQLAATIVRNYGVDVNALADALDSMPAGMQQLHGQPGQPQQQAGMYQDPRVDVLLQQLQGLQQSRQEQVIQTAVKEVESFGSDKEFFEDVREDMADLMDLAAKRKIDLSLEQAYERACKMQPEIARVLDAREAAKRAGNRNGSTQRARIAASSVRGTPSGGSTPKADNLRATIEAAFDQVDGR
jgi:hypothetical protein